jgi:hypothetical protein
VLASSPVDGSFKDVTYAGLFITTKDPSDAEATARLIGQLQEVIVNSHSFRDDYAKGK